MQHLDPAARRELARSLYVASDMPVRQISARIGVSASRLMAWAREGDWPRRKPKLPTATLMAGAADTDTATATAAATASNEATSDPSGAVARTSVAASIACAAAQTGRSPKRGSQRRPKRPPIKNIVDRLYHIINHNLELMETRMSDDGQSADVSNPERDMRAISSVVRSVDKLKEIEPEQSKRHNVSSGSAGYPLITPEEEDRIRRKVVEHILKLRERKGSDGGDRSSD